MTTKPCCYCLYPLNQSILRAYTPVGKYHCPLCKQRVDIYHPTALEDDYYIVEPEDVSMPDHYRAAVKLLDKLRPHLKEMVVEGYLCLSNAYAVARAPGHKQAAYVERIAYRNKPNPGIIAELVGRYPMSLATMNAGEDSSNLTASQVRDKLTKEQNDWLKGECTILLNDAEDVSDAENYAADVVSDMVNKWPDLEVHWERLNEVVCLQLRSQSA